MKEIEKFVDAVIRTMENNSAKRVLTPEFMWGCLADAIGPGAVRSVALGACPRLAEFRLVG